MQEFLDFLLEFVRDQKRIGAIAPSSDTLAREMVRDLGLREASLVAEYGPGTGAFTGHILRRIPNDAELVAFEQNERFADQLRHQYERPSILEASVARAPELLSELGYSDGSVDAIVSGLPWAAFQTDLQQALLDATTEILAPGAQFATFAYIHGLVLPTARDFRTELEDRFARVETSRIVWRNLPPAFVYRCEAPTP